MEVDKVVAGYTLAKFPASVYLILTHEWLPTFDEAQQFGLGFGGRFSESVEIPTGYVRYGVSEFPILEIERDQANTPDGSRIEYWLPIKKIIS